MRKLICMQIPVGMISLLSLNRDSQKRIHAESANKDLRAALNRFDESEECLAAPWHSHRDRLIMARQHS